MTRLKLAGYQAFYMQQTQKNMAERLAEVKAAIARAEKRAGRKEGSVKLVAVSKNHPAQAIKEAFSAGQKVFGENYAQEFRDKLKELGLDENLAGVEWHFLGHLQKNKLKYVAPHATWIHSIDSVELFQALVEKIAKSPPSTETINCLIEVSIAGEETKSGIAEEKLPELVKAFARVAPPVIPEVVFGNLTSSPLKTAGMTGTTHTLRLRGLMCMPPASENPEESRKYFRKLAEILKNINSSGIYPEPLTELSMGMSDDFEIAIEEGATIVRIGTLIFGERSYT